MSNSAENSKRWYSSWYSKPENKAKQQAKARERMRKLRAGELGQEALEKYNEYRKSAAYKKKALENQRRYYWKKRDVLVAKKREVYYRDKEKGLIMIRNKERNNQLKEYRKKNRDELKIAKNLKVSINHARVLTGKLKVPSSHFGVANYEERN